MSGELPTTKGGNVRLQAVNTPESVEPGEAYEVEVIAKNRALVINPFDPDKCGIAAGYKMRPVLVAPDGREVEGSEACVTGDFTTHTWTETLTAPDEPSDYDVQVFMQMTGSGKETDRLTSRLTVTTDAPADADDGNQSGNGGNDRDDDAGDTPGLPDWDPDAPGPIADLDDTAKFATVAVILLALAWIASSASNTAEVAGRVVR